MSRQIRRFGPYVVLLCALVGVAILVVPTPRTARAASYSDPFWTTTASTLECPCSCGCNRPPTFSPEGVSYLTTEYVHDEYVFAVPGMRGHLPFSIRWRSMISGITQMGRGALLSLEWTLEEDGSTVYIRSPDGLLETWTESGGTWTTSDCAIHATLTDMGTGVYEREDLQGNVLTFGADGMLDTSEDAYGNTITYTYNGSLELTSIVDTRGETWTPHHDGDGFMDYIDDPSSRRFTFDHDTYGNLVEIGFPATTDQPSGTAITFGYDAYHRLTSVEDRRGNTTKQIAYNGTTGKVDTVTIGSDDVDFSRSAGRTDRTDQNGNVHRTHFTDKNITQTDMWIASAAEYATTYAYSGSVVTSVVFPRGNRIDYTYNGDDEMTERRRKTTDTSSSSGTDIVDSWTWSDHFVATHTGPLGSVTTLTRNSAGDVTRADFEDVTSPASQAAYRTTTYNAYGQPTQTTDEEGKIRAYTYFSAGDDIYLLQKIEVDPSGLDLETTYGYDAYWNVDSVTDPRGNETTSTYDTLRRLKQRTSPASLSIDKKWAYDANGNMVTHEIENLDKDGDSVTANPWITNTYTYTTLNQVATVVEEIDASTTRTTSFDYDANGNRIRVTKPEGNKGYWTFNERDMVASHVRGETSLDASTTEYAYDDNGNPVTVTDGRDNDTTNTYDLFDRKTKTTDALGHYTTWTLSKRGQPTKIERSNSGDTLLARRDLYYDERGRLWKTSDLHKDPGATYADAVTTIERFKTGHVKTVTNPRGKDTDTAYDNAWRRTSVTDAMGNESSWTLDDNGNPTAWEIEEVGGGGTVTHQYEATYDVLNRRATMTEIDRTNGSNTLVTTYGHDSRGNLVWLLNAKGDPTRFTFDGLNRMIKKEVALTYGTPIETFTSAVVTEWGFDDNNRLESHKDDAGNETTWAFDALDRPTTMTYPNTDEVAYGYDANDSVVELTDPNGSVIADTYDANNRRTARSVTRGTGVRGTTSETYAYDGMGRMTEASDNDYKVEFTYGTIGLSSQVYEEKQSYVGGTAYTKTVTKTYDANGNVIAETYPSGLDLDRTWNDIDRLSTVTDGTNTIASYGYVGSRVNTIGFQNGSTVTTTFTGFRGEVARIHHQTSSPATIVDLQYGYDDNHDRLYERFGGFGSSGDGFAYDKARRLTTAWMGSSTPSAPSSANYVKKIDYTMDDDGNRTDVGVTLYGQSPVSTGYTDNNLNQYTAVGGASPTYDDNGNMTYDGTLTFQYDYRNQIVKVKQGGTTVANYKYDALGRRVEKDDQSTVSRYIYSGVETVSVYDASTTWKQDFVFGQVIDEVLMLEQADVLDFDGDSNTTEATRSFYHRNALGSVLAITDMAEMEAVSYRYDPYGAVTITHGGSSQPTDPLGNPWMYTGRFHDEETGLEYYRARYYSADIGRFLQRDPLGYAPGANLYTYCSSSPPNRTDPRGLDDGAPPHRGPDGSELPTSKPKDSPTEKGLNDKFPGGKGLEGEEGNMRCRGAVLRWGRVGTGFWFGVQGDEAGTVYEFQQWVRIRVFVWIDPPGSWKQLTPESEDERWGGEYVVDGRLSSVEWYPNQANDPATGSALMTDNPLTEITGAVSAIKHASLNTSDLPSPPGRFKIVMDLRGEVIDRTNNRVVASYLQTITVEVDPSKKPKYKKTTGSVVASTPHGGPKARGGP